MPKEKSRTEWMQEVVQTLREEPELSDKEVAERFDTTYQKISSIRKTMLTQGGGDVVEAITEKTGIKKLVEAFTPDGKDCGCEERKEKLNKLFLRDYKLECLTEDEYKYLSTFYANKRWGNQVVEFSTLEKLYKIRARVFNVKFHVPRCTNCAMAILRDLTELKKIYDLYETA